MSRDKQTEIHELAKQMSEAISTAVEQRYIEDEAKLQAVLIENGWRKASDVAKEIFEEIKEILLDYHLRENKKYLKSQSQTKKQFEIETARYRAITEAIKFAICTLDEIEKKYTGE